MLSTFSSVQQLCPNPASAHTIRQGALFYDGPALLLLQTPEGHVLGGLSTHGLLAEDADLKWTK